MTERVRVRLSSGRRLQDCVAPGLFSSGGGAWGVPFPPYPHMSHLTQFWGKGWSGKTQAGYL